MIFTITIVEFYLHENRLLYVFGLKIHVPPPAPGSVKMCIPRVFVLYHDQGRIQGEVREFEPLKCLTDSYNRNKTASNYVLDAVKKREHPPPPPKKIKLSRKKS